MKKCPICDKVLTLDDYETYYDYEREDISYYIICSNCGYDENECLERARDLSCSIKEAYEDIMY